MGKSVLFVDDAATMRQLVSFSLSDAGYGVVTAVDGKDALEKARTEDETFKLIITDLNMPHMDGIELIRQLRKNTQYRFTPIVMLTTESQETKKLEAVRAGATGWIVKPFTPEGLLALVKKFVN